jgi:hypothetical protein
LTGLSQVLHQRQIVELHQLTDPWSIPIALLSSLMMIEGGLIESPVVIESHPLTVETKELRRSTVGPTRAGTMAMTGLLHSPSQQTVIVGKNRSEVLPQVREAGELTRPHPHLREFREKCSNPHSLRGPQYIKPRIPTTAGLMLLLRPSLQGHEVSSLLSFVLQLHY